jgi:hypothetical protein
MNSQDLPVLSPPLRGDTILLLSTRQFLTSFQGEVDVCRLISSLVSRWPSAGPSCSRPAVSRNQIVSGSWRDYHRMRTCLAWTPRRIVCHSSRGQSSWLVHVVSIVVSTYFVSSFLMTPRVGRACRRIMSHFRRLAIPRALCTRAKPVHYLVARFDAGDAFRAYFTFRPCASRSWHNRHLHDRDPDVISWGLILELSVRESNA